MDISVYILTYYHERYIAQALESVLAQKTKYSYEIVISDDCSKDRTLEIVREYQRKYPDVIRVLANETNIGIPQNIYQARCSCRGRYIVNLSGDDYWIDPNKLELQARFLDMHPEYLAVCTSAEQRFDDETTATAVLPPRKECNREYTVSDYEHNKMLCMYGFMMRNLFLTDEGRAYFGVARSISNRIDDVVDGLLILQKGKVFALPDITYAYRATRDKSDKHTYNARYSRIEKAKNHMIMLNSMREHFGNSVDLSNRYVRSLSINYLTILVSRNLKQYKEVFDLVPVEMRKPFCRNVFLRAFFNLLPMGIELISRRV